MDFTKQDRDFVLTGTPEEFKRLSDRLAEVWDDDDELATGAKTAGEEGTTLTLDAGEAPDFADALESDPEFGTLAAELQAAMDQANEEAMQALDKGRDQT